MIGDIEVTIGPNGGDDAVSLKQDLGQRDGTAYMYFKGDKWDKIVTVVKQLRVAQKTIDTGMTYVPDQEQGH